jgi:bifunctional non-homologous end joining protein LigD
VKSKCLNRAEFVVVGWSDPEGSRPHVGALLLGYYEPDGRLIYAGRVGTGMTVKTLTMLHSRLKRLGTSRRVRTNLNEKCSRERHGRSS